MKLLNRAAATAVALTAGATALLTLGAGPAAAIVGGQDANRRYPGLSFVSIDFGDEGVAGCTGTLIAPPGSPASRDGIGQSRWLATSAHCVTWDTAAPASVPVAPASVPVAPASVPVAPAAITIHEGSADRTKGQTAGGVQVIVHPDWAWGVTTTTGTAVPDIRPDGPSHTTPPTACPATGQRILPRSATTSPSWATGLPRERFRS